MNECMFSTHVWVSRTLCSTDLSFCKCAFYFGFKYTPSPETLYMLVSLDLMWDTGSLFFIKYFSVGKKKHKKYKKAGGIWCEDPSFSLYSDSFKMTKCPVD